MRQLTQLVVALVVAIASSYSYAQCGGPVPMLCDADGDFDVDSNDIAAIGGAKGTPSSGPGDLRDVDGDGMITVLDGRQCVAKCDKPNCAVVSGERETTPPELSIDTPEDGASVSVPTVTISGKATDAGGVASVTINGITANRFGDSYTLDLELAEGLNTVTVVARDLSGNVASVTVSVTYINNQSSNQKPVAIARASSKAALSLSQVTLDGSMSHDPDGSIQSYFWQQLSGPLVEIKSASQAIAKFSAPLVSNIEPASFSLTVLDDKNVESRAEVSIDMQPAAPSQLEVKVLSADFLLPTESEDAHADYFPIQGSPIANESIMVEVTISGLIDEIAFEMYVYSDPPAFGIPVTLTRLGESSLPPFRYGGFVTVPSDQFEIIAQGTTFDGQNFSLFVFSVLPENFRAYFRPSRADIAVGEHIFVNLVIENTAGNEGYQLEYADPLGVLANSASLPQHVQIAPGTSIKLPIEIAVTDSALSGGEIPLEVRVWGDLDPDNYLTTVFSLSIEETP